MAPDWLDDLRDDLLPALQARGIVIDARVRLNLEAWLAAAAERQLLGEAPASAHVPVRSIVCKSAREQLLFDQLFGEWIKRWERGAVSIGRADLAPKRGPAQPSPPSMGKAGHRRRWIGVIAVAVLLPTLVWFWPPAEKAGSPEKTPVSTAQGPTDSRPVAAPDMDQVKFVGDKEVQFPWLFGIHPAAYAFAVFLTGSAGLFVRRTRKAQLARVSTRENLREQQVFARQLLPVAGERRVALRQSARLLRRLRPVEGLELDLLASASATAARAGLFAPVWRQRQAMPDYLVLVDRASYADQQAHWAAELARDLFAEGVALNLYEFDRDPRWVAPLRLQRSSLTPSSQRYRPLIELVTRHRGQGLLVIGDGHALIDLNSGELAAWVQGAFAPWPRRVLMTPLPTASWGPNEDVLSGAGLPAHAPSFLLVPARIDALTAAARWLTAPAVPELPPLPGAPAILPSLLLHDPDRWLSREAPPSAEIASLIGELRDYLGPVAYRWLAAAAVYPQLSADLTAYLAHRLAEQAGMSPERPDPRLFEARLIAIAQLPWCRQGWMPDWLRRALFLSLPIGTRLSIKSLLQQLFNSAGSNAVPGGIALGNVARDKDTSWLQRLRDRIGFGGVVEGEPPDSPLRDVIYLGVLRGDYDSELVLDVDTPFDGDFSQAPLTLNPLRWLQAGGVVAVYSVVWAIRKATLSKVKVTTREREAAVDTVAQRVPAGAIYVSYKRPDKDHAERIGAAVERELGAGAVWLDSAEFKLGASWAGVLDRALEASQLLIVVVGRDGFESEWQKKEVELAMRGGKTLLPVLVDGAPMPDDRVLSRFQACVLHAERYDEDVANLVQVLASLVDGEADKRGAVRGEKAYK